MIKAYSSFERQNFCSQTFLPLHTVPKNTAKFPPVQKTYYTKKNLIRCILRFSAEFQSLFWPLFSSLMIDIDMNLKSNSKFNRKCSKKENIFFVVKYAHYFYHHFAWNDQNESIFSDDLTHYALCMKQMI